MKLKGWKTKGRARGTAAVVFIFWPKKQSGIGVRSNLRNALTHSTHTQTPRRHRKKKKRKKVRKHGPAMSSREDPRNRNMSDSSYAIHRATALNRHLLNNNNSNNNIIGDDFYNAIQAIAPDAKVVNASASLAQRRLCELTNFVNRQARIENIQAEFARNAAEYSHWAHGTALPLLDSRSFPPTNARGEDEKGGQLEVQAFGAKLERQGNDVCAQSDRAVATMRAAAKRLEVGERERRVSHHTHTHKHSSPLLRLLSKNRFFSPPPSTSRLQQLFRPPHTHHEIKRASGGVRETRPWTGGDGVARGRRLRRGRDEPLHRSHPRRDGGDARESRRRRPSAPRRLRLNLAVGAVVCNIPMLKYVEVTQNFKAIVGCGDPEHLNVQRYILSFARKEKKEGTSISFFSDLEIYYRFQIFYFQMKDTVLCIDHE